VLQLCKTAYRESVIAYNLNAEFLCRGRFLDEVLRKLLPFVSVIFGNHVEMAALATSLAIHCGTRQIADPCSAAKSQAPALARLLGGRRHSGLALVVITHGADPTVVASISGDGSNAEVQVSSHPARAIDPHMIVDTVGAGDSYAGGFLAALAMQQSQGAPLDLDNCADWGAYAAWEVIQQKGFGIPDSLRL